MNGFFTESSSRNFMLLWAACVSAASLAYSAFDGACGGGLLNLSKTIGSLSTAEETPTAPPSEKLIGTIEPIPDRVFRIMPYNDWPILRVDVHEGQRLTWHRENGTWVGDNDVLTTQFETPAEIDGTIEAVELSKTELEGVRSKAELAKLQAESDFEQSKIRETNAKQELDRISNLNKRDAESLESHHRAENLWKLAVVERSRAEKIVHLQNQLTDSEIRVAEGKLVQARSELDLANFKRDMSWGKVPVHLIKGSPDHPKQVVVTRVSTAIGDQPPRNGAPPVWVELVDDSRLFVRTLIDEEIDRTVKPGTPVRFTQKDRKFHGHVVATLPVVDSETQKIQALLEVENPDRVLRIGSKIEVSFESSHQ